MTVELVAARQIVLDERDSWSVEKGRPEPRRDELRILIADDHPVVREGLRAMLDLEGGMKVVGEAANGFEVLNMAGSVSPDIVLMDVRMSKVDGIRATEQLKEQYPRVDVIVLSNYDNDEYVFECIKAGARGYLLKDVAPEELTAAIRTVSEGRSLVDPSILRKVLSKFSDLALGEDISISSGKLTSREEEVLRSVAQGLTTKEVASKLCVSVKTVKSHITKIYSKVGIRNRSEATMYALKNGLGSVYAEE